MHPYMNPLPVTYPWGRRGWGQNDQFFRYAFFELTQTPPVAASKKIINFPTVADISVIDLSF